MINPPGHRSRDGFQWTREGGLQAGIPSLGVIKPTNNLSPAGTNDAVFDVIVVGGGYTGLTAIRDLALAGHRVLLPEARDRIGGRSWSSNIDGYPYELGGTWLFRYGMSSALEISMVTESGLNKCFVDMGSNRLEMSHEREDIPSESALIKYIDVDGHLARTVIPFPHDPHYDKEAVAHYDAMSMADRLAEIADELTPVEYSMLEQFLAVTCGSGRFEDASFFEVLRWWALMNYSYRDFIALGLTYKLRHGQPALARGFFDEALATGNLRRSSSNSSSSSAGTGTTATFRAHRVICTVPLNVLYKIDFSPPLSQAKSEASKLGHVNQVAKCHAELGHPELRSVTAFSRDAKLTYGFGDGTTPAGNTHPEEDIQETLQAWRDLIVGRNTPGTTMMEGVY
ncbi:uncharacterized protein B0T15DRAFT_561280 [Chaetomium strumarium]|uniref:Amine oxidase domain-containing protein n=1 Tax=Chaetomium strumarium TaxID=1170767 RepID=A0AAJ0GPR2_9PEZI|nr:hypothetical protein B0T15DRAFT_561280 [Chaetomium strumarium]